MTLSRALILSYVYVFCFLNVERGRIKVRMAIFYVVTFLEDLLLVTLWSINVRTTVYYTSRQIGEAFALVAGTFCLGIGFMLLYYRHFHATKLGGGSDDGDEEDSIPDKGVNGFCSHSSGVRLKKLPQEGFKVLQQPSYSTHLSSLGEDQPKVDPQASVTGDITNSGHRHHQSLTPENSPSYYSHHNHAVFNCVLPHQAAKKKKLPSILPPPPVIQKQVAPAGAVKMQPFWKEPLPSTADGEQTARRPDPPGEAAGSGGGYEAHFGGHLSDRRGLTRESLNQHDSDGTDPPALNKYQHYETSF